VELTLDAALSGQGALGHASYALLVLSMMMRRMVLLRVLVIASAAVYIVYATWVLSDPVSLIWETLLIVVNAGQLALTWWRDRSAQFDAREEALYRRHFETLKPSAMRVLLARGAWVTLEAGEQLTRTGDPVDALWYLASGSARVEVGAVVVGHCEEGGFVGEMTVSSGEPAFADVVIVHPAEAWRIEAPDLRDLTRRRPDIGAALGAAFFRMIRHRVTEGNTRALGLGLHPSASAAISPELSGPLSDTRSLPSSSQKREAAP